MMTEQTKQKFTAKVRRGLVWVHRQAHAELDRLKAAADGGRVAGFTSGALSDVEAALVWIEQNKESETP
jgi:hypothetical protein